eukprot:RCo052212
MSLTEICTLSGHTDRVWCVAWHPRGDLLASCGGDRSVRIWRPEGEGFSRWICVAVLDKDHRRTVRCVAWSPCGRFLACASFDATVTVYEASSSGYTLVSTLEGHENEVKWVAWSPEGNLLATCSRDKTLEVWEKTSDNDFEMASVLHGHQQDVKFVTFHPFKQLLYSASYDDSVRQWQEEDDVGGSGGGSDEWVCSDILLAHSSTVWGVAFEKFPPDEALETHRDRNYPRLVSCSDDCTMIVWQQLPQPSDNTGKRRVWRNSCTLSGYNTRTIYSVDWSPQNVIISAGGDDSLRVFEETSRDLKVGTSSWTQTVCVEKAHRTDVNCVRWHPTEPILASAGDDGLVKIWAHRGAAPELLTPETPKG